MLALACKIDHEIALSHRGEPLGTITVKRCADNPTRLKLGFDLDPDILVTRLTADESIELRSLPSPRRAGFLSRLVNRRRPRRKARP